jgi:anti-sigma-K factor RskA
VDTQAYIQSGIIEAYVLGLASGEEVREVEAYAARYAEIRKAITDFEIALEKQALENAVPPPASLKEKVMAALEQEKEQSGRTNGTATPKDGKGQPQTATKVVSLTAVPKSVRWLRGAVAACIILFLGSAILNFYYYSQYRKFSKQYSDLLVAQNTLLAKNETYRASFNVMTDTAVVKITMQAASPQRTGAVATVYWNKQSQEVFLTVNNLPTPTAGKQYQLWAIVEGKPVDAGLITDATLENKTDTFKMSPKINNAQAFAITLEDEGGSPTPHLEQLYVLGKVS